MHMRTTIPAIAALAVGGLLLANWMRKTHVPLVDNTRVPRLAFTTREDLPPVSLQETLVVRTPDAATITMFAALTAGGLLAWNLMKRTRGSEAASHIEESIELNVPVSTAYNQWTQFEEFPRFMESVQEVKQLDDTHLHWRANVAGRTKEWDAEITEQIPDQRIAWRSTSGVKNAGDVSFHKLGDNRTQVVLRMDYQPETPGERIGGAVGAVKFTAKGNLKRFKQLVEASGVETGAWRGTVGTPH